VGVRLPRRDPIFRAADCCWPALVCPEPRGKVYSLDARSGCTIWEFGAIKGVRSVIVVGQRTGGRAVYFGDAGASCTFRGSVVALDTSMGKMLWKAFTVAEEPKPDATNAAGVHLMGPSAAAIGRARPSMRPPKGLRNDRR
jgi:outer membrane protein assembly factor BamB